MVCLEWFVSCWEKLKKKVKCQFCGGLDANGHLFWERTFPPFLHVRELPEFAPLGWRPQ